MRNSEPRIGAPVATEIRDGFGSNDSVKSLVRKRLAYAPVGRRSGRYTTKPPRRPANASSASTSRGCNSSGAPTTTASKLVMVSALMEAGGWPARTSSPFDTRASAATVKSGSSSKARRTNVAVHDGRGSCTSTLSRRSCTFTVETIWLSSAAVSASTGRAIARSSRAPAAVGTYVSPSSTLSSSRLQVC